MGLNVALSSKLVVIRSSENEACQNLGWIHKLVCQAASLIRRHVTSKHKVKSLSLLPPFFHSADTHIHI